jgi:hypothetical protein
VTLRDHFGQDLGAGKSGARHHQTWLLQGSGVNYGEEEERGGAEGLGGVSGHAFGHDCPLGLGYRKRGPRGRRRKYDNTVRSVVPKVPQILIYRTWLCQQQGLRGKTLPPYLTRVAVLQIF